jgi:dihydroorotate dehydrogenase (NAD+) catalytic subunit
MFKNDFYLDKPLLNAAGTLGFSPDPKGSINLLQFGAFVTNPISNAPRTPAKGIRFSSYPGGFMLHSGLPNPGLGATIRGHGKRWARSPVPVIVHLLALEPNFLARMIERLETNEGVMGVEIGLPPDIDPDTAFDFARAALGELPAILRLPLEQAEELAPVVIEGGASAVSLGAPRGKLEGISGRMYGPAVFPLALRAVEKLAGLGIPVIGAGGVYQARDVNAMLDAGARAVQVDTVLWRGTTTLFRSAKS